MTVMAIAAMNQIRLPAFRVKLKPGATIGILSEAGCPGIAEPALVLLPRKQEPGATSLVGLVRFCWL